jgi:hypothetical protein
MASVPPVADVGLACRYARRSPRHRFVQQPILTWLAGFDTTDQDKYRRCESANNKLVFALANAGAVHSYRRYERLL